eukprot:15485458-Alexandrium_andersonii.AAC.1
MDLSAAPNRRKSETPIPRPSASEARRLLNLAVRPGGLRLSPIRSRGEGRFGPSGALGPPPTRAGLRAPSSP